MTLSIPRINLATASAIRQGANLAWLAMEIQDIPNTGHVAMTIKEHLTNGKPCIEVIRMVQYQWKSGAKWELVGIVGVKLLRKILNVSI